MIVEEQSEARDILLSIMAFVFLAIFMSLALYFRKKYGSF